MSNTVGGANVEITADDSQARRTVSGFFGFLGQTGRIAAGVAAGMAFFQGIQGAIQKLGQSTIGANASMEQYVNTLSVVLKSNEKAVETLAWAEKFAASTPFEIPDIVEATVRLSAYGLKAKDVLESTGNMAAVMGKPLMQAVEAVADAQTGELERLKEFGITKDMLIKKSAEMGKSEVVNAKGQITDMAAFNEALFALMEERFQGGMEIQSKSFDGMISNIKDAIGTTTRELSKPMFEKLKSGIQQVLPLFSALTQFVKNDVAGAANTIEDAFGPEKAGKIFHALGIIENGFARLKKFVADLQPAIQNAKQIYKNIEPVILGVGKTIAAAFGVILEILPPILDQITQIVESFTGWEGFIPSIAGIGAAIGSLHGMVSLLAQAQAFYDSVVAAGTLIQGAWTAAVTASTAAGGGLKGVLAGMRAGFVALNLSMLANPFVLIASVLIGLGVAFYVAYQKSETFRNGVDKVFSFVKKHVLETMSVVSTFFREKMMELKAAWDEHGAPIEEAVRKFSASIQKVFEFIWPYVVQIAKDNLEDFKRYFDSFFVVLEGIIKVWSAIFKGDWEEAWKSSEQLVKDTLESIKKALSLSFLDEYAPIVAQGFETIKEKMVEKMEAWKTQINDWFTERKTDIENKLTEWKTSIENWFTSIPSVITTKLMEWKNAIVAWTEEQNEENKRQFAAWGISIEEWFKSIPSKIDARMESWKDTILAWYDRTKEKVNTKLSEWWSALELWFTSIPAKLTAKYEEWKTAVLSWYDRTKENIKVKLGDWWATISTWFSEAPGKIRTSLDNWWTKMSQWFSEIPARIGAKLEEWWQEIKSWFAGLSNKPEVKNAGRNMIDKVSEGNKEKKQEFIDKLGKIIIDVALGALAVAAVALLAAGREIVKRIISGVQEVDLTETGKDIIRGLINGMSSMATAVWEKAKEIASGIRKFMENALQVKSPSRVMIGIGQYVGAGLIKGMDETIGSIQRTTQKLAEAAVPNLKSLPVKNMQNFLGNLYENKNNGITVSGKRIEQNITINSPSPLSPSEIARKNLQASRQLAMEWGI